MKNTYQLVAIATLSLCFACNTPAKKNTTDNNNVESEIVADEKADTPPVDMKAFFQAALEGDINTVESALNSGVDVNAKDEDMHNALMLAAYNGHVHIIKLLLDKGASIDEVDGLNRTALMFAATGPFAPAVEMLIKAGANVNITDNHESWTPVMMAASEGQLEVVKILVANGADLSMVDTDGESPLDFAKSKNHSHVVSYLETQMK